jgi:hypothetical protein
MLWITDNNPDDCVKNHPQNGLAQLNKKNWIVSKATVIPTIEATSTFYDFISWLKKSWSIFEGGIHVGEKKDKMWYANQTEK